MTQTQIQPGSIYTLPSGNIVRAGQTLRGEVACEYINSDKEKEVVSLCVGWLQEHGVMS